MVAREHGNIHRSGDLNAAAVVRLLERCDAFRKPERFDEVLLACECDARGRLGLEGNPYPQRTRLLAALAAAQSVATEPIAREAQAGRRHRTEDRRGHRQGARCRRGSGDGSLRLKAATLLSKMD